ncbi:MAG TPA: ACP dehydratase [Desulfurivibrionaceae bacterium]|nr:ACP dehydratase [Desulfurivibrionaceae bacterium]
MTADSSGNPNSGVAPPLPCPAIRLVAQRPPMLLAGALTFRDRPGNLSVVAATVPESGVFVGPDGRVIPEYFVELMAQGMAAVNGYDAITDAEAATRGFLVGIDNFVWLGGARGGEELTVELVKTFEFGPVTVMGGRVISAAGALLAEGEIKAWEQL